MIGALVVGYVVGLLAFCSAATPGQSAGAALESPHEYPSLHLSNHLIEMDLYLPDAQNGYYRSSRFDWSGLIARVSYAGHTFFGPWQSPHDPTVTDAVLGPAEEFGMQSPPGYDEAKPGETFLKIGIGALQREDARPYEFWKPHPIVKAGEWKVTHGQDWVQFDQTFHGDQGWAYRYTKRIALSSQTPAFVISHRLENIGSRPISTTVYCHNFTIIDNEPIGPSYRITVPFDLVPKQLHSPPAVVQGRTIMHSATIAHGKATYFEFTAVPNTGAANSIDIENERTGAGIHIKGTAPLVDFHFYGSELAACPEPFTAVRVAPGSEQKWESRYILSVRGK